MKVYLVIENYSADHAGTFETVVDVWADETVAQLRALELEEKNECSATGYYVHTFEVQ